MQRSSFLKVEVFSELFCFYLFIGSAVSNDNTEVTRRKFLTAATSASLTAGLAGCSEGGSSRENTPQDQSTPTSQDETTPTRESTSSQQNSTETAENSQEQGESKAERKLQQAALNQNAMMIEIENPAEYISIPSGIGNATEGYEGVADMFDMVDDTDGNISNQLDSMLIPIWTSETYPESKDAGAPGDGEYAIGAYSLNDDWEQGYRGEQYNFSQDAVKRFYDENINGGVVQSWDMPDELLQLATG